MALTLGDVQEAEIRLHAGGHTANSTDAEWLLAELDATRARVAELERERDEANAACADSWSWVPKLAAREAECAELRAAVDHLLREWLAWRPGITGVARTRAEAALSRPPGSDEALRAMMTDAIAEAYDFKGPSEQAIASIVARLLPATQAQGENERGNGA